MAGLQAWLLVEVIRGDRPRFAAARWWLMLALWTGVLPVAGYAWENLGCFVAASAALSFRGWRRMLPTPVIAVVVVVYEILAFLPHVRGATSFDWAMEIIGQLYLYVYISAALAASAALVTTVWRLDRVRDQLAEHAASAERRRLPSDLHDILGQSLTAIALKASLARELVIGGDRAAARAEITGVLVVAEAQAAEIDAVTRNQRRVELSAELQEAVELLSAAEIEVTVTDDLDDLNEGASSLLGWALREGTTNILRHAHARRCEIALRRRDGQIHLELRNDGAHGARGDGTGLAGLTERLAAAQGSAHAQPLSGGRFELRVELPG
jgi:two-component system sensor histidine kinase DesK